MNLQNPRLAGYTTRDVARPYRVGEDKVRATVSYSADGATRRPYLHETRSATEVYRFEMTEADRRQLLDLLRSVQGKVMLSGYPSALYDTALAGWNRHAFELPNHAAGGKEKRRMTEVLWCNF
jgi:DNA adenine methylase